MASQGPFVALRTATGTPLLAWGGDTLVRRADDLGYRLLVLTSDSQHRDLTLPGVVIKRGCWYYDSGAAAKVAEMQQKVLACAPDIAEQVRAGVPTLITCWLGESRSAVMLARVLYLVTGKAGTEIVGALEQARGDGVHAPKNVAFRRWVQSWPSFATASSNASSSSWPWALAALALVGIAWWAWGK